MMNNDDERVLVVSALPVDGEFVCTVAGQAGISAQRCRDIGELGAEIRQGAGAAVVSQRVLCRAAFDELVAILREQPSWSDFPLIIVALANGAVRSESVLEVAPDLGNVVVLQRPLRVATLVTALRAALRARRRQYEVRRAQQLLEESLSRERARAAELEAIMEAVPIAIFIARDPDCRNIVGNRMSYELLRLPQGSNLSTTPPEGERLGNYRALKDGREVPLHDLPLRKAAFTGQPVRNYEYELILDDGTSYSALGNAVPLIGDDGRPRGAVGAFMDITERKRHEERLRQAQKLESIGLLAGGIAHDFNNLLTSIMGNASLVLDEVGPSQAERIKGMIGSAERAAHLTRQLLAYSGQGQFVVRDLDVSEIVSRMSDLVQFSIPRSVDLAIHVSKRLPVVCMDPGQFEQVLMNVVINAGEAIGEGNPGKITVATSMADIEKSFVDATGEEVAAGRYVSIEVSDTGTGIDEKARPKIFDPFFTTKFQGRGLGLAAVGGILRAQKGGITVESAPGRGSVFRVLLPVAEHFAEKTENQPAAEGRATILVVDDDAAVRDFISAALGQHGYRTLAASDGRDALAACDRESGDIDAAVLDVVMPRMGAKELMPAMKARQPSMRVLLTSGYDEAEARRLCCAYPGAAFIQKPYTAQQLTKALDELLSMGSG